MSNRAAWIGGLCLLLIGCKVAPPKPPLVETIAVLPFDNESNDINASDIMQKFVYWALKPSVYRVIDIKEVNERLANVGIVDGGQLAVVDPTKLGKDLGVQALLFGSVENFHYVNIGFYMEKKVTLSLRLVEVGTGATLWENTATGAHRLFSLDKDTAAQNFAKGLADQLTDKLFNTPLESEARLATMNTLFSLPGFSFAGFASGAGSAEHNKDIGKQLIKTKIWTK
jgi:hypothetical protein